MRVLTLVLLAIPLAIAGCVTPPAEEIEAAAADMLDAPPALSETPVSFSGSFGPGAGVCPMFMCIGEFNGETATEVDVDGVVTGATLTMTWDASAPHMEEMYFGLAWGKDDEWEEEYVEGASPLALELSGLEIPDDLEVWVWAWPVSPAMGLVQVMTPQSFTIEGALAVAAPAEAAPEASASAE